MDGETVSDAEMRLARKMEDATMRMGDRLDFRQERGSDPQAVSKPEPASRPPGSSSLSTTAAEDTKVQFPLLDRVVAFAELQAGVPVSNIVELLAANQLKTPRPRT